MASHGKESGSSFFDDHRMNQQEDGSTMPGGEWSGFFREYHHDRPGWMHLYLDIQGREIRGDGTDYVGPWNLAGSWDPNAATCCWTKKYVGKHRVKYEGTVSVDGIQGTWSVGRFHSGPFHIWPRHRHDLEQKYLEAETGSE